MVNIYIDETPWLCFCKRYLRLTSAPLPTLSSLVVRIQGVWQRVHAQLRKFIYEIPNAKNENENVILDEDFRLRATSMMCSIIGVFCLNIERTHSRVPL